MHRKTGKKLFIKSIDIMKHKISFAIRLLVAIILFQSLYFKFGSHEQAIHIFTTLDVEPWGRFLLGGIELVLAIGILLPITKSIANTLIGLLGRGCHKSIGKPKNQAPKTPRFSLVFYLKPKTWSPQRWTWLSFTISSMTAILTRWSKRIQRPKTNSVPSSNA